MCFEVEAWSGVKFISPVSEWEKRNKDKKRASKARMSEFRVKLPGSSCSQR